MEDCNRFRILVAAAIVILSVATVTLLGVLISREVRANKADTSFSEKSIRKAFPSYFLSAMEYEEYKRLFYVGVENRTAETENTSSPNGTFQQNSIVCQKPASSKPVYHGCCVSCVELISPGQWTDVFGKRRTLVQFVTSKQYFPNQTCQTVPSCSACICSRDNTLFSALVVKLDVKVPEQLSDTEIVYMYFPGCCKCVNN